MDGWTCKAQSGGSQPRSELRYAVWSTPSMHTWVFQKLCPNASKLLVKNVAGGLNGYKGPITRKLSKVGIKLPTSADQLPWRNSRKVSRMWATAASSLSFKTKGYGTFCCSRYPIELPTNEWEPTYIVISYVRSSWRYHEPWAATTQSTINLMIHLTFL